MVWVLFLLFIACELGERVSNEFEELDDAISSFNWYKFPQNTCRILPLIQMCTQQPVQIKVFGKKISCTREIFQKVSTNQSNQIQLYNVYMFSINFAFVRLLIQAISILWCFVEFENL